MLALFIQSNGKKYHKIMKQKNVGLIFISPDHNLCRAFFLTHSNVFPSNLSQRPNSLQFPCITLICNKTLLRIFI